MIRNKHSFEDNTLITAIVILFCGIFLFQPNDIFAAKSTFSSERIEQAVREYISSQLKDTIEIEIVNPILPASFPFDNVVAEISNKDVLLGSTSVQMQFMQDSRVLKKLEIPVKVKRYRTVCVSAHSIPKGKTIEPDDLRYTPIEVSAINIDSLPDYRDITGKSASRTITGNTVITRDILESASVISRGSVVDVLVIAGAVKVRARGTALEDATIGSPIRVRRNGGSGKVLEGVATSDGSVMIQITQDYSGVAQ